MHLLKEKFNIASLNQSGRGLELCENPDFCLSYITSEKNILVLEKPWQNVTTATLIKQDNLNNTWPPSASPFISISQKDIVKILEFLAYRG